MSKIFYLDIYKKDEPVNRSVFMKGRKVIVKFNPKFLEKIDIDTQIKNLPLDLRRVIVLCCIEDIPVNKVAEMLCVHRSTVHRRLCKGLDILSNND